MKNKKNISTCYRSTVVCLILFLFLTGYVYADNIITSGTSLKVLPGTTIVSTQNLILKSGAALDNAGTIILRKNLTSENTSSVTTGTGTIEFSGTTGQIINGAIIFQDLTLSNPAGLSLSGNTTVNGNLTLTSGRITLGNSNLNLGSAAVIIGTPSASVMIVSSESGELRKEFPAGYMGDFIFPVGTASATAEYSPVTLAFSSGTFASGNYAGVSVTASKYPDPGITGNYLERYWNLSQSGITGLACNATFQYLPADVTGTEDLLSCTRVNPLPWTTYALTDAATHMLTATGLTSLSTFTGLKSTTTPQNQELANIIIPDQTTTCYDAVQVLTVAGNGATFVVENGGSVTLIAGSKISLMPGVKVNSGGYMLAKISTDFCNTLLNPLVINPENIDALTGIPETRPGWIKIYPNPTEDSFILEFSPEEIPAEAHVTLYSMQGQTLSRQTLKEERQHRFSLSVYPTGIYVIRVRTDNRIEIAKIVKR